jgi:hypothetical protein
MYKLDDEFLAQLGLGDMPEEQKQAFLQHIYSELEIRVGEKLTAEMSDAQLDEFGYFVDKKDAEVRDWFAKNVPNYKELPEYKMAVEKAGPGADELSVLAEFGATKWLQLNRPDYPEVVKEVLEALKQEILANKNQILGQ